MISSPQCGKTTMLNQLLESRIPPRLTSQNASWQPFVAFDEVSLLYLVVYSAETPKRLYGSFIQYVNLGCKGNSFPLHFQILCRFLRAHIFFVYGCAKITIIIGTNEEISKIILFLCPYDNILPYSSPLSQILQSVATTQIRFFATLWIQPKFVLPLQHQKTVFFFILHKVQVCLLFVLVS